MKPAVVSESFARREWPNTRFVVYDHEIAGDRAWFRWTLMWTDPSTGETRTRAGMQLYRVPDAMRLLSMSRSVIYEQLRSGRLRSVFASDLPRRQASMSAWLPLNRTSGTFIPRYSDGRV